MSESPSPIDHVTSFSGVKSSLSPKRFSCFPVTTTERPNQDIMARSASNHAVWRARRNEAIHHLFWVVCVSATYLATELTIWGLSFALASAQLQYFASIVGMAVIFSAMAAAGKVCLSCDNFYHRWIKSKVCAFCPFLPSLLGQAGRFQKAHSLLLGAGKNKQVDFINAQLGIGFSVPIIMLNHVLGIRDIGYIIATSAITNVVSWASVFLLSLLGLFFLGTLQAYASRRTQTKEATKSTFDPRYEVRGTIRRAAARCYDRPWQYLTSDDSVEKTEDGISASAEAKARAVASALVVEADIQVQDGNLWRMLRSNGYVILCLAGTIGVGIPLELLVHDGRALDGFSLWLCWLIAIRLQRTVKSSSLFGSNVRCRHSLATMVNPVLVTTLLMLGFTRVKGRLTGSGGIAKVLRDFSSGSPLYTIWTAVASDAAMPHNPTRWFGAGDFALSLLECGVVAWGFKLYECRKQLFSVSGVSTLLFSTMAAAGNVFLSVMLARALGLQSVESLAFAARSATLALAKPSVKALGGNVALNATLVVSNGILGQLVYPVLLDKLSVPTVQPEPQGQADKKKADKLEEDDPVTVAAGAAIGINGAAMGVSYLYEVKSRAAPYAALSMTMFGVMTVVFTTLEPFKNTALKLASW
ncbi:LrgB-like protein [Metarhizium album ARSEF 1941]|uniref:LrgB-like protein n=1 Tax=Metarhizium album (strain ARSEF 1941) TaxID=1081103 RepID=A0A0B2X313_METAS|nr:LrgB-like protein [Metarhizium album ARSEF 1941]KHN99695.1 LrgB-like protein [Metarhizium album ARSEF 1941]